MDNSQKKIYIGMKRVLLYSLLFLALSLHGQELLPYPMDTIDGKVYYRYTVEKSVGLYRISKNFGVSQEDILQANPELRERGLRFEEVIRIPTDFPVVEKVQKAEESAAVSKPLESEKSVLRFVEAVLAANRRDTVPENQSSTDTAGIAIAPGLMLPVDTTEYAGISDTLPEVHYTDTVRLAFLLPLQAEIAQRSPTIDRFYDFYCGSLLAIKHQEPYVDSLGVLHTPYYAVHSYDVGKDSRLICQLIDSGALAQMDVLIGPAYIKQVESLSAYVEEHHIPTLIPFLPQLTPKLKGNPYQLKFNPAIPIHAGALMEYLDTLRNQVNIVQVDAYDNKLDYPLGIRILRDSISARGLPTTHTTIRQILADSVSAALKDSVENLLLFHSERYSSVQLLLPYLLSGRHGKQLTILSQYAWQGERILLPSLYTSAFRTPNGEQTARYEQDFAHYFGHKLSSTQPRYDLLGYDLTNYMLKALQGGTFQVPDTITEGIQSSLLFKQNENGGYDNTHIVIERH